MIQVNLLPAEHRKAQNTPLIRFLTIIAGVVLTATALGSFLYVHFGLVDNWTSVRKHKEEAYYAQKKHAEHSLSLKREYDDYQKRRITIENAARKRVLWSRKLDELFDIIDNPNETHGEHRVWLTSLTAVVDDGSKKRRKGAVANGGSISFKGYSATGDFSRLANFRDDIENSAFFEDVQAIDRPSWRVVDFNDELIPARAGQVEHMLTLKPLDWRYQEAKKNLRKTPSKK